jgi:hypothetical protein
MALIFSRLPAQKSRADCAAFYCAAMQPKPFLLLRGRNISS